MLQQLGSVVTGKNKASANNPGCPQYPETKGLANSGPRLGRSR